MKVSLIAALDQNRLLGAGGGIPWHLPRDQRHFREFSAGKALLLGRKTFEEMAGWFTTQRPLVLSRDRRFSPPDPPPGFCRVASVEEALETARGLGVGELVVCGGAQIYRLALPFADELVLTEVHAAFHGDAFFPEFSLEEWVEVARARFEPDALNAHAMSIARYRRR